MAADLQSCVEEIYSPLKTLGTFRAESDGEARMDTGNFRSVLIVTDRAVTSILRQILQNLREDHLSSAVWKGITDRDGYKLWVEPLQGFGEGDTCFFRIADVDVFPCQEKSNYKVGVSIKVKKQRSTRSE